MNTKQRYAQLATEVAQILEKRSNESYARGKTKEHSFLGGMQYELQFSQEEQRVLDILSSEFGSILNKIGRHPIGPDFETGEKRYTVSLLGRLHYGFSGSSSGPEYCLMLAQELLDSCNSKEVSNLLEALELRNIYNL